MRSLDGVIKIFCFALRFELFDSINLIVPDEDSPYFNLIFEEIEQEHHERNRP